MIFIFIVYVILRNFTFSQNRDMIFFYWLGFLNSRHKNRFRILVFTEKEKVLINFNKHKISNNWNQKKMIYIINFHT